MDRRHFLESAAAGLLAQTASAQAASPMIGIQAGAVSFVDEGVEPVLDIFQSAKVNTLFLATFTYGRGIAGRQVPGQPLPDHGKQQYDADTFHGGSYTRVHPQYYRETILRDFRAPDVGEFDLLEAVVPAARKRGLKTICWFEDVWSGKGTGVPGIETVQEVQIDGRNSTNLCFNNPNYRAWLLGTVEDYAREHEIDGIMWGSERQGAFANMLQSRNTRTVTCFCPYCEAKAKARGISVDRAREGFQALAAFVGGPRPIDGHFVELWRLMLRYPELLAWEQLWHDSLRETYAAIHAHVKSVKPTLGVGWHIWHNNSFNPIYRAQQDLKELAKYSDFLKMVMYHNCGGERMASYIRAVDRTLYADVPAPELLDFHYQVLGYPHEKPLAELPQSGFSADYVFHEAARARQALNGTSTQLWPGIDIDIPTAASSSKSTPQGTHDAVAAAFRAGADGVLLSRKYSEMRLANLRAAV
jgi:hypothetical protein